MRNWKKSLLLAAGFAVLIPSAAMATQKNSEQTDTVTVEVKNVKGGALGVYYDDSDGDVSYWVPIGEKVKIPKGTELTIKTQNWEEYEDDNFKRTNFSWNSEKYGEYSGSVVKTKIQAFYNEPMYVAKLGRCLPIRQHDQSAILDNNTMMGSDC